MANQSKKSKASRAINTPKCGSPPQDELTELELTEKSVQKIKARAQLNLVAFRLAILQRMESEQEVDAADFHFAWSDAILNGTTHEVWEAFRESAKSQIVLRSFPTYQLAFPQERFDYIVLIKNNATLASGKLKEIANEYLTNKIASANLTKIIQQSADVFHIESLSEDREVIETRIEAYGKGASVRGASYRDKRPKIAIIDDPQDTDDAKSDVVLEADWNWFLSDILFLGKTTRIFLIGNNLGDKCIVERVMRNAKEFGFKDHRVAIEMDGEPTWPQKFAKAFIAKEKEAYQRVGKLDIWLRERMCQSTSEETRTFNLKDFPRFSFHQSAHIAARSRISATLDPAASTASTACFRAIVINAVTPEGYWMILEILYGRWDSVLLIDRIFEAVARWGLKFFGIEKGMLFQFMEPLLRTEMVRRQIFFELIPLEHGKKGTKLQRIKMLAPRSKSKSIWLPDFAEPVDDLPSWITELELELNGVTKDEIKSEYIDLVDALAMQDQIATTPSAHGTPRPMPGHPGYRGRPALQRSYRPKSQQ